MSLVRYKSEDIKLTQADMAELQDLANMPDDEIDYSDAPPLPKGSWVKMNTMIEHSNSQSNNVHVDEDIAKWFNKKDSQTQAKINNFLRQLMYFDSHLA